MDEITRYLSMKNFPRYAPRIPHSEEVQELIDILEVRRQGELIKNLRSGQQKALFEEFKAHA
jgi:hypothetical protein